MESAQIEQEHFGSMKNGKACLYKTVLVVFKVKYKSWLASTRHSIEAICHPLMTTLLSKSRIRPWSSSFPTISLTGHPILFFHHLPFVIQVDKNSEISPSPPPPLSVPLPPFPVLDVTEKTTPEMSLLLPQWNGQRFN